MSREQILGRVREALSNPTDTHVRNVAKQASHSLPVLANGPESRATAVKEFLPFVGPTFDEHTSAFRVLSEKLQTEFICVSDNAAAQRELQRLADSNSWKKIGLHDNELVQAATCELGLDQLNTSDGYDVNELESCDAGISACDALVAQTASVLVTARSAGGKGLSVLPPHHVVVATTDQMVTTMADGYAVLRKTYGENWPSFISFITGPSRTADIERVLVLGAHGPKRLTVILIGAKPESWQ